MAEFIELKGKTEKEVLDKAELYLEKYPSQGYGTVFRDPIYRNGEWIVFGARGSSCD